MKQFLYVKLKSSLIGRYTRYLWNLKQYQHYIRSISVDFFSLSAGCVRFYSIFCKKVPNYIGIFSKKFSKWIFILLFWKSTELVFRLWDDVLFARSKLGKNSSSRMVIYMYYALFEHTRETSSVFWVLRFYFIRLFHNLMAGEGKIPNV